MSKGGEIWRKKFFENLFLNIPLNYFCLFLLIHIFGVQTSNFCQTLLFTLHLFHVLFIYLVNNHDLKYILLTLTDICSGFIEKHLNLMFSEQDLNAFCSFQEFARLQNPKYVKIIWICKLSCQHPTRPDPTQVCLEST